MTERRFPGAAAVAAAALAAWAHAAVAQPASQAATSYTFEAKEDARARSCNVLLTLGGGGERVEFRLIHVRGKGDGGPPYVGFIVGLGAGGAKRRLASATFAGSGFDSAKRLAAAPLESGEVVGGTAEPRDATALTGAFFAGDFVLTLVPAGGSDGHAYRVAVAPPDNLRRRFDACAAKRG